MIILKVSYRAIKWDNYQGGCGMPYNDEVLINIDDNTKVSELGSIVIRRLKNIEEDIFTGEVRLASMQIINVL